MKACISSILLALMLSLVANGCSSSSAQTEPDPLPTATSVFDDTEILSIAGLADGRLLLAEYEPSIGTELYVSDGTPEGTALLVDLYPGPESGFPATYFSPLMNGGVYFAGDSPAGGRELWFTDGTIAGTIPVAAMGVAPNPDPAFIRTVLEEDGRLIFVINQYFASEVRSELIIIEDSNRIQ